METILWLILLTLMLEGVILGFLLQFEIGIFWEGLYKIVLFISICTHLLSFLLLGTSAFYISGLISFLIFLLILYLILFLIHKNNVLDVILIYLEILIYSHWFSCIYVTSIIYFSLNLY